MNDAELLKKLEAAQKRKRPVKKKAKKKASSKPRRPRRQGKSKHELELEIERLKMQRAVFGRPVHKRKSSKKSKPKKPKKPKARKPRKKAAAHNPKPGSPAWVKKMAKARAKAARKRKK